MASNSPAPAQWGAPAIPIDPALQSRPASGQATTAQNATFQQQQQQQQQYQQYYQQGYYPQQQYQPAPQAQTQQQQTHKTCGGMDTADVNTLNDPLASAGVDLRAEEESLQRSSDHAPSYRAGYNEDRTHKQPSNLTFDTRHLGASMRIIGDGHKIATIPEDSVTYLALALRARLQTLITSMIAAAHHRTDTQFDRAASFYDDESETPMWRIAIRSDVAKQLAAIEKIDREEEGKVRKERAERTEAAAVHAAAIQATQESMVVDEEDGPGAKKKRKKDAGPGVTARNMSDDVRKKMSNAVASQAAGVGKYSWMSAGAGASSATKAKPAAAGSSVTSPGSTSAAAPATGSTWARPYLPTKPSADAVAATVLEKDDDNTTRVTLKDAMFVVEKERGHGGGRGAAMGWV